MLLIKIFEWHGVGLEAIVYTNNEVEEQDRLSVYLHRSAKSTVMCNQRDDESINWWNIFNLSSVNFRPAVLICINIILYCYKKEVT